MTKPGQVWNSVAVADPDQPDNVIKPNADGSINVGGSPAGTSQNVAITTQAGANPVGIGTSAGADSLSNSGRNVLETRAYLEIWNGSTWDRAAQPNANSRIPSSAASNNATVVKAAVGKVYQISGLNTNAAVRYLKLYNKATAPAPGTDNALLLAVFALGATQVFNFSLGAFGLYFPTGIGLALVTGASDTDNTGVGAGDILGLNVLFA